MINLNTLEKTAGLSRLNLTEEEKNRLINEMSQILDYFEALQAVDTEGVEPLYTPVEMQNFWRKDQLEERNSKEELVEALQERAEGQIKVPQVV